MAISTTRINRRNSPFLIIKKAQRNLYFHALFSSLVIFSRLGNIFISSRFAGEMSFLCLR